MKQFKPTLLATGILLALGSASSAWANPTNTATEVVESQTASVDSDAKGQGNSSISEGGTSTIGAITSTEDSNNTKNYTDSSQDNDTKTLTVSKTDTDTKTITKTEDSNNTKTFTDSSQDNDTKTLTVTKTDTDTKTISRLLKIARIPSETLPFFEFLAA